MFDWFSADLHPGHVAMVPHTPEQCQNPSGNCNHRGWRSHSFDSMEHMHQSLVDRWNSTVGKNDRVLIVGDAAMGNRHDTLTLFDRLNGHKSLVPGNHDHVHPMHGASKVSKWMPHYSKYFDVLDPHLVDHSTFSKPVQISHFPWEGDHAGSDREDEIGPWRPPKTDMPLIHGHLHSRAENRQMTPHQLDVGVDGHDYTPWNRDEIAKVLGL